jgi:hypothetical protein
MKASWYALPLFVALAAGSSFAACSSDDDDPELNQAGSGGSGQGAGGSTAAGTGGAAGAGGAGGAGGEAGTGGMGGAAGAAGASQGGAGACGTPEAELAAAPQFIKNAVANAMGKPDEKFLGDFARYDYENAVVYYVPPRSGDFKSQLYSKNGELICEPDGGIAPMPDERCPDFAESRTNPCVVWENPERMR